MDYLALDLLVSLIEEKRYGVEYQPFVSIKTGEIVGYEALSRFYTQKNQPIAPDLVYASLHKSPLTLFQVEYEQKKLQLEAAPPAPTLFVNVDQDSYFATGSIGDDNPFLKLFDQYADRNITVELIENSELVDVEMSLHMIESLLDHGIETAVDDLFGPRALFSFEVMQLAGFLKLDKSIVENRGNGSLLALVLSIIEYGRISGKKVILEGVETEEDFEFAVQLGVDYVQGFLYKAQFIRAGYKTR